MDEESGITGKVVVGATLRRDFNGCCCDKVSLLHDGRAEAEKPTVADFTSYSMSEMLQRRERPPVTQNLHFK